MPDEWPVDGQVLGIALPSAHCKAAGRHTACTIRAYAAHDRVGCAFSRSLVSCGSANCVRDAPQPQPQPQLSSSALVVSDNGEGPVSSRVPRSR